MKKTICLAASAAILPAASLSAAAVIYATPGSEYTQDFDGLAVAGASDTVTTWTNGETLTGWHASQTIGTGTTDYTAYTSTAGVNHSATNRLRSLGNNSDRALGSQNGDSVQTIQFGLQLSNTTAATFSTFTLTYTGEQWRAIGNEGADGLTFSYQVFASGTGSLTGGTWTAVGDLDFDAPRTVGGSTGLDGNLVANRVEDITAIVTGVDWGAGQELWLRWTDTNPSASGAPNARRAAMGIDDLTFTAAIPEPSAALLGALGSLFLLRRKR